MLNFRISTKKLLNTYYIAFMSVMFWMENQSRTKRFPYLSSRWSLHPRWCPGMKIWLFKALQTGKHSQVCAEAYYPHWRVCKAFEWSGLQKKKDIHSQQQQIQMGSIRKAHKLSKKSLLNRNTCSAIYELRLETMIRFLTYSMYTEWNVLRVWKIFDSVENFNIGFVNHFSIQCNCWLA